MRIVVYTSIFGAYNELIPQPRFEGVDYVCFTDQPLVSDIWDLQCINPIVNDPQLATTSLRPRHLE